MRPASRGPKNAIADATKCPSTQMFFRANGRPRYYFHMRTSGASMYGGLYSFAKSFDEKIGWGKVGVLLSVAIIAVAAVVLYHTLRDIDFDEVVAAIEAVEKHDVAG